VDGSVNLDPESKLRPETAQTYTRLLSHLYDYPTQPKKTSRFFLGKWLREWLFAWRDFSGEKFSIGFGLVGLRSATSSDDV